MGLLSICQKSRRRDIHIKKSFKGVANWRQGYRLMLAASQSETSVLRHF